MSPTVVVDVDNVPEWPKHVQLVTYTCPHVLVTSLIMHMFITHRNCVKIRKITLQVLFIECELGTKRRLGGLYT